MRMISKEDIKKLADLSRVELSESELEIFRSEIDSILNYVGQVKDVKGKLEDGGIHLGPNFNVMREDSNPRESGQYSEALLREAPHTEKGFIKVKKIL